MPAISLAEFGFHVGTHLGYGQMGNSPLATPSIPDRSMSTFDLQIMPGYRLGDMLGGLMMDYRLANQLEQGDPGETNLSGQDLIFGLAISYEPGLWKFMLGYDFKATHSLSGADEKYMGSGFRLLFGYEFLEKLRFDFLYTKTGYNTNETSSGIITDYSADKVRHWNLGFGLSYSY